MNKKPRTKADLIAENKRIKEVNRKREFVKNEFYPALIKSSDSVEDAKMFLSSLANMIMESFLAEMKEKKLAEYQLHKKLDPKSPKYKEIKALLELFKDESVFVSRELVEGMKNEVQMMIDLEMKERKLDTLKTNFL